VGFLPFFLVPLLLLMLDYWLVVQVVEAQFHHMAQQLLNLLLVVQVVELMVLTDLDLPQWQQEELQPQQVLAILLDHHFLRADNWKVRQEEVAAVVVIMVVVVEKIMEVHLLAVVVDPHTLEDIQIYQCLVHQPSRVA
jgi:hypothetical protein